MPTPGTSTVNKSDWKNNLQERVRPWVRRVLFVDRRYRSALLWYSFFLALLAVAVTYFAQRGVAHLTVSTPGLAKPISNVQALALGWGLVLLIFMALFITFGFIISHRLIAPFFRMRRHMDSVTEGRNQRSEFHFRQADFFLEVGESYNRLLHVIQAQRHRIEQLEKPPAEAAE